jgi:hypothetical protein
VGARVLELSAYLALHPERRYRAEELRDPLSPNKDHPLEADTIRTYANTLRRALGPDRVPDAGRAGYTLTGVSTDWARFQAHVQSAGAANGDHTAAAQALASGLALIQGVPFSAAPKDSYGWASTELLTSQIEVAVEDAAERLVQIALDSGDWPLAQWAVGQALLVTPAGEKLNVLALTAAGGSGQPDILARAWREVANRFARAAVPDCLATLHETLREQLRTASNR